ncbi:thioredoxin family protein [Ferruginibacter profundus]
MNWIDLNDEQQLSSLKELSKQKAQLIFKHSTRCAISSMAKNRLERATLPDSVDFYYLDLVKHRQLSSAIAEEFGVYHESPQVLLIKNGECIYDESHSGIQMEEILEQLSAA